MSNPDKTGTFVLLIAPEGIEMLNKRASEQYPDKLLIAPEGIEIKDNTI